MATNKHINCKNLRLQRYYTLVLLLHIISARVCSYISTQMSSRQSTFWKLHKSIQSECNVSTIQPKSSFKLNNTRVKCILQQAKQPCFRMHLYARHYQLKYYSIYKLYNQTCYQKLKIAWTLPTSTLLQVLIYALTSQQYVVSIIKLLLSRTKTCCSIQ